MFIFSIRNYNSHLLLEIKIIIIIIFKHFSPTKLTGNKIRTITPNFGLIVCQYYLKWNMKSYICEFNLREALRKCARFIQRDVNL